MPPPQWSACIQPGGKEYFYSDRDSGLEVPVVTEARMCDPKTANKVGASSSPSINRGPPFDTTEYDLLLAAFSIFISLQ